MEYRGYIYVVLIKALTGLGGLARKISHYEYTHVAVSLNEKLEDFVTFSRRKHYSPFEAGFMHEKREHYAFGTHERVKVKIFRIPVSREERLRIERYINRIEHDKEYVFNLYSMLTMPVIHGMKIYKAHNCMSFVSRIIKFSHSVKMEKPYYQYNIRDIDCLLAPFFWKECHLSKKREDYEYMKPVGMMANVGLFLKLNGILIARMLKK